MRMAFIVLAVALFSSIAAKGAPSSSNEIAAPSDYKTLKPGLWETTLRSENTAAPIDMSAMMGTLDPASRARVEAVLKRQAAERAARGGAPEVTTKTKKECVTQAVLDKRKLSLNSDRGGSNSMEGCTKLLKSRTSSRVVVTGECTVTADRADKADKAGKFTTELTFEIKSPEETFMAAISSGNLGGQPSKTSSSASSRWLGADCGNAKLAN